MLEVRGVQVDLGGKAILRGVDLGVQAGEIVCLLGASGCGKTTLLRVIAGLQTPLQGEVVLQGDVITHTPTHQRRLGLMFQDFALFPHLNVGDNVAFGLRMAGMSRSERDARVREVLAWVGLAEMAGRDVAALSGGERQRVALARSLAPKPRLLLLDEPLGALDAALRERLTGELREMLKRVGVTAIYVTHDQAEAYAVADRIALMEAGNILQIADPATLYHQPKTAYAAHFLGLHNVFPVTRWANGQAETSLGTFALEQACTALLLHPDSLCLNSASGQLLGEGVVERVTFRGRDSQVWLRLNDDLLLAYAAPALRVVVGQRLKVNMMAEGVVPLIDESPMIG